MNKELLKFRKVRTEDARDWHILVNKVWRYAYHHIFPEEVFVERDNNLEERVKYFDNVILNDDKNIAYVAEYEGKIIGIMCGSINSSYEYFKSEYADLIALYIDPNFHGYGIGSKFKEIFEQWAIEKGAKQYVIGVLKDNVNARKVYESWKGKISNHEQEFVKLGVGYPEVFYTYKLIKDIKKHL